MQRRGFDFTAAVDVVDVAEWGDIPGTSFISLGFGFEETESFWEPAGSGVGARKGIGPGKFLIQALFDLRERDLANQRGHGHVGG